MWCFCCNFPRASGYLYPITSIHWAYVCLWCKLQYIYSCCMWNLIFMDFTRSSWFGFNISCFMAYVLIRYIHVYWNNDLRKEQKIHLKSMITHSYISYMFLYRTFTHVIILSAYHVSSYSRHIYPYRVEFVE